MRKTFLFNLFILCSFWSIGQEGIYSQPFQSGLVLNPALIGTGNAPTRLGGIYRTQWKVEESPYENYSLFFESNLNNIKYGLILNQSKTGDIGFKKTSILLASGLSKKLGAGNNKLSFGAQFGLYQMNIDYVKLQFDNQYNPEVGFDGSLGHGEEFESTNLIQPDINIGLTADFEIPSKSKIEGQIGFSIIHINTPGRAFNKEEVVLPMNTIFHAKVIIPFNHFWAIEPIFIHSTQDLEKDIRIGLNADFQLLNENKLKFGLANNLDGVFSFLTQFQVHKFSLGLSIDANISKINRSITDNNTFELSMIYNIQKRASKTNYRDILR